MLPLADALETGTVEATAEATAEATSPDEPVQRDENEDGMASSAERMTILRMVEQGKISAEDGARLLNALGDRQAEGSKARATGFDTSRHLQVRVTDLVTNRQKVNVTVPIGLFQLVWRWLPASAQGQFEQVQAAIDAGAGGRLVEVMDPDSGVRVEITLL
jgi:hypothetical protein